MPKHSFDTRTINGTTYYSPQYAAKLMGMSYGTVLTWLREKRLRNRVIGGQYYIHEDAVREYKLNGEVANGRAN